MLSRQIQCHVVTAEHTVRNVYTVVVAGIPSSPSSSTSISLKMQILGLLCLLLLPPLLHSYLIARTTWRTENGLTDRAAVRNPATRARNGVFHLYSNSGSVYRLTANRCSASSTSSRHCG
jgi:hypothetical protein